MKAERPRIIFRRLIGLKIMGANAAFPAIIAAIVILVSYYGMLRGSIGTSELFLFLQIGIPPVCAWLSVFSQKHILEMDGGELYFSFPVGRFVIGPLRSFLWSTIISVCCIICVGPVLYSYYGAEEAVKAGATLLVQCLFLSALGFGLMTILKNSMLSILAVIAYCVFFLFVDSDMLPFLNMYMNADSINAYEFMTLQKTGVSFLEAVLLGEISAILYFKL